MTTVCKLTQSSMLENYASFIRNTHCENYVEKNRCYLQNPFGTAASPVFELTENFGVDSLKVVNSMVQYQTTVFSSLKKFIYKNISSIFTLEALFEQIKRDFTQGRCCFYDCINKNLCSLCCKSFT